MNKPIDNEKWLEDNLLPDWTVDYDYDDFVFLCYKGVQVGETSGASIRMADFTFRFKDWNDEALPYKAEFDKLQAHFDALLAEPEEKYVFFERGTVLPIQNLADAKKRKAHQGGIIYEVKLVEDK